MKSRFEHLRGRAIKLRKTGASIKDIERELGIPRSTLSGWLRKVVLTTTQSKRLYTRWKNALGTARVHAVKWHNAQKVARHEDAQKGARASLSKLARSQETTELALALLYLGEGAKRSNNTLLGNSDPEILRFFITCLRTLYHVPTEKIRCDLHLRADQTPKEMIKYWAKVLGLPEKNFISVTLDQRTAGRPTYAHYKGVCVVRCGRVDIERKLGYIARGFCQHIVDEFKKSA